MEEDIYFQAAVMQTRFEKIINAIYVAISLFHEIKKKKIK